MGTVTLVPDALVTQKGSFTLGGGAVSTLAALNDGSDATYVQAAGTLAASWSATYRFPALAIPAGAVVQSVAARIRYSNANYLNDYEMIQPESIAVGKPVGTATTFYTFTSGEHPTLWAESSTVTPWTGAPRTQGYDGQYLGKLLLTTGARLYAGVVTARNTVHNLARIQALELIVTYNELPTVTVQQPTGVVGVSRPPVAWTHTDPEDDPQVIGHVKFYTSAQVAAGGFDPDVTVPVDEYEKWQTVANLTPTRPLSPNGGYSAYVRTAQPAVSGVEMWSAWASTAFTLTVTGPTIATFTAVHDPAVNAIHVNAAGGATFPHADYTIALQRSFDAGTTWEDVPASQTTVDSAARTMEYWDYAIPGNTTVNYRVQSRSINGSGDPVSSDWSSPVAETMPAFTDWWLRDLKDPIGLSMILRTLPSFGKTWNIPQTVGYGLGDTAATVTSDGAKEDTLSGEVDLLDGDAYDTFEAMIKGGNTLLLQDVFGHMWYVRPGESTKVEQLVSVALPSESTPVRNSHRATVEFISVEPPSG